MLKKEIVSNKVRKSGRDMELLLGRRETRLLSVYA